MVLSGDTNLLILKSNTSLMCKVPQRQENYLTVLNGGLYFYLDLSCLKVESNSYILHNYSPEMADFMENC